MMIKDFRGQTIKKSLLLKTYCLLDGLLCFFFCRRNNFYVKYVHFVLFCNIRIAIFVLQGESPFTSTYNESKERSQIIGMSFAGVISLVVFAVYLSVKACSPMTYYQEKINSKCKKKMMEILVAEFENAIDKPVSSVGLRLSKPSKILVLRTLVGSKSFNESRESGFI